MPASPRKPVKRRYSAPAVSRAVAILRILADHPEGISLADLSRISKIAKNSVFRILSTLVDEGCLAKDEGTQRFTMTGQLLDIAFRGTGADMLSQIALEPMRKLRESCGETVLLGKLAGHEGVVLEQVPGRQPVKVVVELGARFRLHTAAPAKAILAAMRTEESAPMLAAMTFKRFTPRTIVSLGDFSRALEKVKIEGCAWDLGEEIEDIRCVAAAIIDHRRIPVAAIWVTGPASRITGARLKKIGPLVLREANAISTHLGCPADQLIHPKVTQSAEH